ncbi:MAG: flavodoxin family protein [Methanocorpusculum sp.]|nr:flavodoxin family protein [Methanocorpusculum sp.]MDE2525103.1 flavodoxin family protein [Methanocorpusculum sp.]
MKILGIATSPRKGGNSQKLVESILAGAKDAGAETELICLTDQNIHPCIGCGYCKSGHDTCAQKDDMSMLYEKIAAADGIIFGAPIYFGRLNAQAYMVIDRMWALLNPDFSLRIPAGKKFAVALTCGPGDAKTIQPMEQYFQNTVCGIFGFTYAGTVWQNQLMSPADLEKFPEKITEANELGKRLV